MQTTYLLLGGLPKRCGVHPRRVLYRFPALLFGVWLAGVEYVSGAILAEDLVNLDFTAHLNAAYVPKFGPAAVGVEETDQWNVYSRDVNNEWTWRDSGVLEDLVDASGGATGIDLAMNNAGGFWVSSDPDPMFRTYLYPGVDNLVATLTDLPAGLYDLFCYAHGAEDGQNPVLQLTVGGGGPVLKQTAAGPGWQDGVFLEGADYVVFRGVPVQAGESLELTVMPGRGGYAALNGLQLLRVKHDPEPWLALVVPTNFATVEDDGYSHALYRSLRLQQVYDQSMFPVSPIEVTSIRMRRDASMAPFEPQTARVRVTLASTAKTPDGLSLVWEENLGPAPITVFDGALTFGSLNFGSNGQPSPFDIVIPFERSFLYDRSAGHLLVEFITTEGVAVGVVDSSNEYDDHASRVFASSPDAPQAEYADTGADVLELVYQETRSNCVPVASGLVAWWRAEGDATEVVSSHGGALHNGATFGEGMAGQAFDLSLTASHVRISDREALHALSSLSVEAWVKPRDHGTMRDVVSKWDGVVGVNQRSFALSLDSEGVPYFIVSATGGHSLVGAVFATNTVVGVEEWAHLAGTYDGSRLSLYVNGELRGAVLYNAGIFAGTGDLGIGGTVGGLGEGEVISAFGGWIDEVSLYERALSESEVRLIWKAGALGKCLPAAPSIVSGPVATEAVEQGETTFSVSALGTGPLHYEWWSVREGLVEGAAGPSLTLTDLNAEDDGNEYYVVVSNLWGTVTSGVVRLTVHRLPKVTVQPQSLSAELGSVVSLSVSAEGAEPLSYRWRKDGVPLGGAEAPTLVLFELAKDDMGLYQVQVLNPYGSTLSEPAFLRVVSGVMTMKFTGGSPTAMVSSEAGGSFSVDWSDDLVTWQPLATMFDVPSSWIIPDFTPPGRVERRFYRLRRL